MALTNELLQAILGMQQNAQANLPVTPNNGNPAGAHNMPSNSASVMPETSSSPNSPSWLNPSPAMGVIQQLLASMGTPNQGIAVGEPNGSQGGHGFLAGYDGPRPGTPEWQALRDQGQHPLMDYIRSQRGQGGGLMHGVDLPVLPGHADMERIIPIRKI